MKRKFQPKVGGLLDKYAILKYTNLRWMRKPRGLKAILSFGYTTNGSSFISNLEKKIYSIMSYNKQLD
jgi:hypothetical protein